MLNKTIAFGLGVFLAPVIRPLLRPVVVELMRATMMAVDEAQKLSASVREDLQDVAAEAQAQRDAKAQEAAAAARRAQPPAPDPRSIQ
jgi:hypothetical protein